MIDIRYQIAELRRELALRANVYPKWSTTPKKKAELERSMARLQAAHDLLVKLGEQAAIVGNESVERDLLLRQLGFLRCDRCEVMRLDVEDRSSPEAYPPQPILLCEPCRDAALERQSGA
jgi:hypothetical protein